MWPEVLLWAAIALVVFGILGRMIYVAWTDEDPEAEFRQRNLDEMDHV